MIELVTSLFHGLIGLPALLWDIVKGMSAAYPFVWYFLGLGLVYSLLSFSRSVGWGVLVLFSVAGAGAYFVQWTFHHFLVKEGLSHHEALFLSLTHVLLLVAPLALFVYRTPAGHGLTVMDGFAIGAFVGLGYSLIYHLHFVLTPAAVLSWPPGAFETTIPAMREQSLLFFPGWPAVGAILGFGLVLSRKWTARSARGHLAFALLAAFFVVELLVGYLIPHQLLGEEGSFWWTAAKWVDTLGFSGGVTKLVFLGALVAALAAGEVALSRLASGEKSWVRLEREPARPNVLSELFLTVGVLFQGPSAAGEMRGFFGARRRLAGMDLIIAHTQRREDAEFHGYREVAADVVADRKERARATLEGQTVMVRDREGEARWKTFVKGLLLAMVGAYVFLVLIRHFGLLISEALGARLGRDADPMGFVYATILVTGLSFAIVFYGKKIAGLLGLERLTAAAKRGLDAVFASLATGASSKEDGTSRAATGASVRSSERE